MAAPLTEAGIERLRELIISGTFLPGSKLPPEPELALKLGVSRNTAREAVRALSTARVLDVRRGDGTYVTSLRPELLLDGIGFAVELMQEGSALELLQVRRILEPAATGLAARNVTPESLAELEKCLEAMRRSGGNLEKLVFHDAEFHAQVAAASGNMTLLSILNGISSRTFRARVWHGIDDATAIPRTIAEHERILEAITMGDAELAQAAALAHVATTEAFLHRVTATSGDDTTRTGR
ncbi:MAG: GntR family transcriptional regulator [Frankiales bacterium]|nr:GntR family transcriptional regulator [Frankiales bacterium]